MEVLKKTKIYFFLSVFKSGVVYYFYYFRNKNVSYFDYKQLSKAFPIFSVSKNPGVIGNKCYGNLWAVKKALSKSFNENCVIEHGLYFGEYVLLNDLKLKRPDVIYTYGNYRKKVLENCNHPLLKHVRIETVGPYINYVSNFKKRDKLEKIKNKYGKILLVFPTHSSPEIDLNYDEINFVNKIKKICKNYDTVFISLFWLDILKNKHIFYENLGYKVVTAGTRNDPRFLNRLKDLIEISSMTMSNDIGTHIGYCISLNKPHYYYYQNIETKILQSNVSSIDLKRQFIVEKEKKIFDNVFSSQKAEITDEQIKLIEYYWGKQIVI